MSLDDMSLVPMDDDEGQSSDYKGITCEAWWPWFFEPDTQLLTTGTRFIQLSEHTTLDEILREAAREDRDWFVGRITTPEAAGLLRALVDLRLWDRPVLP
jgi:hypothetical protein